MKPYSNRMIFETDKLFHSCQRARENVNFLRQARVDWVRNPRVRKFTTHYSNTTQTRLLPSNFAF